MQILTVPKYEKKLRQKSNNLNIDLIATADMQKFFEELGKTMLAANGLGLAAPQVAQQIRVIAVNINGQAHIFINPNITKKSLLKNTAEEGCLSVPGRYGKVKRHKKITLVYLDENGQKQRKKFMGLASRVIQHEINHLDGILFIDKLIK
ncbi:peptide deformylase [Candidatus Kuenenbacteria bacterium RIFCSPHIGHO2_02_FULL_39_13]|uniref:Peptide deformylase n=1 Tax=Candidatus Kuenenbacteria bacterium RIFCSPHIGHO2_02_FULL_39_13 TaxID=1798561 RepID=A0A1F6FP85_9BACT|nr:MAG: peptide deformylase [Candidatus Kuenenbacteria bacterium RIFCSPHIGHO2_02_FULL_39_13]